MNFGITLAEHLMIAASASLFCTAINYENELNLKVAASNVNVKMHQLSSKQRILGVRETVAQWKTSEGLRRTGS